MASFDAMKQYYSSSAFIGEQIKEMSNMVINETFSNSVGYRKGVIYDSCMKPIKELDFKFLKVKTYTIEKDQVEYMVQFRPKVAPEIDFDYSKDQKHRFGFYLDILDDNTNKVEKWLIVGKDKAEFDKYNVLKCNWTFEWYDIDRQYHKCLGCVRDRNNYNSGIWNDGFVTSIENQTSFIVPTNFETLTIDYDIRFMITDNYIHPKTYRVTKITDTFPIGISKIVLSQSHYNKHTDYVSSDLEIKKEFKDIEPMLHMICDYDFEDDEIDNSKEYEARIWHLDKSRVINKIYVNGSPQTIHAISNSNYAESCKWHIHVDNEDYTNRLDELKEYLNIVLDSDNNLLTVSVINKDMAGYKLAFSIYDEDKTYYDSVEMEVVL